LIGRFVSQKFRDAAETWRTSVQLDPGNRPRHNLSFADRIMRAALKSLQSRVVNPGAKICGGAGIVSVL
jgi:hypothetical protein